MDVTTRLFLPVILARIQRLSLSYCSGIYPCWIPISTPVNPRGLSLPLILGVPGVTPDRPCANPLEGLRLG